MKECKYIDVRMFKGPEEPSLDEEWNKFYNTEHAPLVIEHGLGVIRAYRYRAIEREGAAPKYLTIYEMETPDAMNREDIKKALHTAWYEKMQPHFQRTGHGVYRQIYPEK